MTKFAGLAVKADKPSRMTIRHPFTGKPLVNSETGEEAWIDVLSATSGKGRAHDRAVTDKQLKMRNGRRPNAEELEGDMAEKAAVLTTDWHLVTLEGDPLNVEFSLGTARQLYGDPDLSWVRDQVIEHANDLGNFRPTTSPA